MTLDELQERFARTAEIKKATISIGASNAEAGKIIRVLEYGSVAGQKPWPHPGAKTGLAVNPDTGAEIVVSVRAPQGIIRAMQAGIVNRIKKELTGESQWLIPAAIQAHLEKSVIAAGQAALEGLRNSLAWTKNKIHDALELRAD